MKKALIASLVLLLGCPPATTPPGAPPQVAPVSSAAVAATWAEQAELVSKELDGLVAAVEKGDKDAALKAHERAYFERYENTSRNLEVASQKYLDPEPLEPGGKPKNVAICREDLFGRIKYAVSHGAPAASVRALVDELVKKVRDDAKKLDEMKVAPP